MKHVASTTIPIARRIVGIASHVAARPVEPAVKPIKASPGAQKQDETTVGVRCLEASARGDGHSRGRREERPIRIWVGCARGVELRHADAVLAESRFPHAVLIERDANVEWTACVDSRALDLPIEACSGHTARSSRVVARVDHASFLIACAVERISRLGVQSGVEALAAVTRHRERVVRIC